MCLNLLSHLYDNFEVVNFAGEIDGVWLTFAYGKYTEKWITELKDTAAVMATTTLTCELRITLWYRPLLSDGP
jgi:hypothetical protein